MNRIRFFLVVPVALGALMFTTASCRSLASVKVSVEDPATVSESATHVSFVVTLSEPNPKDSISVQYTTKNGNAIPGTDYTTTSGTLSFETGEQTKTVNVPLLTDDETDGDKNFSFELSDAQGATITKATAEVTILDYDTPPDLVISDVSANESAGSITFTVTANRPFQLAPTMKFTTSDETTTAGDDYTPQTNVTLTFEPGVLTKTFTIFLDNDDLDEDNETFKVTLSDPQNAQFVLEEHAVAIGTIVDNDPTPTLSVNDAPDSESAMTRNFMVTLSAVSGRPVTVNYATSNGTATAGSDYSSTAGTLTFEPGDTSEMVSVSVTNDDLDESNETFSFNLSGGENYDAQNSDLTAIGTIADNDPTPSISIADIEASEGEKALVFTVTLSNPSSSTVSVNYATSPTGSNPASSSTDYISKSGTLIFSSGQISKTITVIVQNEDTIEEDETLKVTLSNPQNASIATVSAVGTIENDDIYETRISAGFNHVLAVRSNGTLWSWGSNTYGQLGDGTTSGQSSPVQIGTDSDWLEISAARLYSCGIRSNHTLWCWGYNKYGQLGSGTTLDRLTPTQVDGSANWKTVVVGDFHTCGIQMDSTLWCWGYNNQGQLGDETKVHRAAPTQVGALTNWQLAGASGYRTCGIQTNGSLWCWGQNNYGQLGDGTTIERAIPGPVGMLTSWKTIGQGGQYHTCVTQTNNTLWCWGHNGFGQIGDATMTHRSNPTQIEAQTNWHKVSTGHYHTCAMRTDNSLWCWGNNDNGEIGDGTTIDRSAPKKVEPTNGWQQVSAGYRFGCAIRLDNSLWCWGENEDGQLGDGSTTNRLSPKQVVFPDN